jgi:hypothetical protein
VIKALPFFCTLAVLLLLSKSLYGQTEKVIYETFEVTDTVEVIHIDIAGKVTFEPWPADRVMAETSIMLEGAPPRILDFFIEQGRYALLTQGSEELALYSKDKVRRPVKYKENDCFEQVSVRVFVPVGFELSSDQTRLVRKSQ